MIAQVIYDYEAQTSDELNIKEGQILLITDDRDQDWWEATQKPINTFEEALKGLVPLTYVEEVYETNKAPPISVATAIYDYTHTTEEEISMHQGDLVKIYEKSDNDWWFVKIDNDVGLVPATYVEEHSNEVPVPTISIVQDPINSDPKLQKSMLMNALDGFGFETRTSTGKTPTGIIYGPDDVTYYSVLEIDKKKKKNSQKGLLGVCQKEFLVYFLDQETKEINYKIDVSSIKKTKDKKTKLVMEMADGEVKEFEGEKTDISALVIHLETAIKRKNEPKNKSTASPVQPGLAAAQSLPRTSSIAESPIQQKQQQANTQALDHPQAIALYDYTASNHEELSIVENEILYVLDQSDQDWWLVKFVNKSGEGLVPRTYIEIQKKETAAEIEKNYRESEVKKLRQEQEQERIKKQMLDREKQRKEDEDRAIQRKRDEEQLEADRKEFERKEMERKNEKEAARKESQKNSVPATPKVVVNQANPPPLASRPYSTPVVPPRPQNPAIPGIILLIRTPCSYFEACCTVKPPENGDPKSSR